MLELEEAHARILATIPKPVTERIALNDASQRILTSPVQATIDLPVFDNSSMDGYAVHSSDIANATSQNPVSLRITGRVAAGEAPHQNLAKGCAVRLFTGSPLPAGADAVVIQEDTRLETSRPNDVFILDAARPGENIRLRGEDVKQGTLLLGPGERLTPNRIALLAALGLKEVTVGRRPRVGLLATGSELKAAGEALGPGQIYESNRAALTPLIRNAGGVPNSLPIVADDLASTRSALDQALAENDIAITCGGVSVGELDFVKAAFESLGGALQFWKVAIKPGKPFVFGRLGDKFLFGLPGNPVSALVTFMVLVHPALLRWQGVQDVTRSSQPGILAEALENSGGRRHFMRVNVDNAGNVRSAGIQASHVLSSVATANGLLDVPPKTLLAAGTMVRVLRWD